MKIASIAAHAGLQFLRVLFWAPILLLTAWVAFFGTERWRNDEYWQRFPPSFGCDDSKLLDVCTLRQLLYMWLAPALLALGSLGLLILRTVMEKHEHRSSKAAQWGAVLLPPRRFWLWWCGGITMCDLLVIGAWAAVNAAWMYAMLDRYFKLVPIFSGGGTPLPLLQLELVAVALGSLLFPNLLLLFYPVARGSVVLQASGITYPDAIRYHRWLGHFVMVIVTAHSLGFWGVWLYQGAWLKEALDQGSRINNLAGGLSFLFGLTLWLSSLEVARRANYETFYKLHHIGFWGFMFAGCCHYWGMVWYFLPGLMLYGVDAVYRFQQALWESSSKGTGVQVAEAVASPGGSMMSLLLAAPRYAVPPTGFVWLNIPHINSKADWHPFEFIAVPLNPSVATQHGIDKASGDADCHPHNSNKSSDATGMLLHIKSYSRWTKQLVKLVQKGGVNIGVKLEGPYCELQGPVLGHCEVATAAAAVCGNSGGHANSSSMVDGLIIVAGGVGLTAAFSVFQELAAAGAAVQGLPALIIWVCRNPDELQFLSPRLLAIVQALGLDASFKFYCTSNTMMPGTTIPATPTAAAVVEPTPNGHSANTSTAAAAAAAAAGSGGGLVTSSLCPVVALSSYWCQAGHKALLHLVVFAGTLGAVLLVRYYSTVLPSQPWTTGQTGAAYVTAITTAILLPGTLVLWIALGVQRYGLGFSNCPIRAWVSKLLLASRSSSSEETHHDAKVKEELSRHLLSAENVEQDSAVATAATAAAVNGQRSEAAAAAAAAGPAVVAAAAVAAKGYATLTVAEAPAAAMRTSSSSSKVRWQLNVPSGIPSGVPSSISVELGRPPVEFLVRSWVAMAKQLPIERTTSNSSSCQQQQQQYIVYGMGPTKMVADVQLLCDEWNRGSSGAVFSFVQKTHEL